MRDIELNRALLGLTTPWTVACVDVDMARHRVVVRVDRARVPSAECRGRAMTASPAWRHLDTMQFTTWIEAEVPRVVRDPRGQATPGALGRAGLAVHRAVRADGH